MSSTNSPSPYSMVTRLLELENTLVRQLREFACGLRHTSLADARTRLETLDPSQLSAIEDNLRITLKVLERCATDDISPWDDKAFFAMSMSEMGLSYPADFLGKINAEDIIEGYNFERRQIFRNLRFMETTNYSLLEVMSYDWPMLFDRPPEITRLIIKLGENDMWVSNRTVSSNIPKHCIRELRTAEPQICEVEHKYFAPLYEGPNRPHGALSVCRARSLEEKLHIEKSKFLDFPVQ